jgi:biopolymer transport protein ExbD
MADIDTSGGGGHKKGPGVKKSKKLSTRVDLTPMVDLGFLLITFFIFTTTMSSPTAMKLNVPKDTDEKDQTKIKQSGALTIIMGKGDQIYYYMGELTDPNSQWKTATYKGIRDIILDKKKEVVAAHIHDKGCEQLQKDAGGDANACLDRDFMVIIKPGAESSFKNTVDILDEMTINVVKRYALVDISDQETTLVKATEAANGIK